MTSRIQHPPLRIRPGVSRGFAVFLVAAHSLGLAVVSALPTGAPARVAMAAAVLLGLACGLYGPVMHRFPWSLREAVWRGDGGWALIFADGRELEGRLLPATYVGVSVVVLAFRCGRIRTCFLPLSSDNLDPDLMRRLRVRLRLTGTVKWRGSEGTP